MGPDNPASGMPARRVPPLLEPALSEYYAAMERVAAVLREIFATCWQLPADWFVQRTHRHASALRILNYLADDMNDHDDDADNLPLRASAHADYGPLV